jgi:hypothetical protein
MPIAFDHAKALLASAVPLQHPAVLTSRNHSITCLISFAKNVQIRDQLFLYTDPEEPVCIYLFRQTPESKATLPPFCPIEVQKWFGQIFSQ